MSRRPRVPNPVAAEIENYFQSADTDQGVQSSWAAFTSIALGGFGGSPEQERKITDRRFADDRHFREGHGNGAIAAARLVRNSILLLPPRAAGVPSRYDVLYAAHGGIPWGKILDEGHGKGMVNKVTPFLGGHALLGVALLTEEVRTGYAAQKSARQPGMAPAPIATLFKVPRKPITKAERKSQRAAAARGQDSCGGFLVGLCLDATWAEPTAKRVSRAERRAREEKAAAAEKRLALVKQQAAELLREAEACYLVAREEAARALGLAPHVDAAPAPAAARERPAPLRPRFASGAAS